MQTQQSNRPTTTPEPVEVTPATATPKRWQRPTFEQVPLNEALADISGAPFDGTGGYSS